MTIINDLCKRFERKKLILQAQIDIDSCNIFVKRAYIIKWKSRVLEKLFKRRNRVIRISITDKNMQACIKNHTTCQSVDNRQRKFVFATLVTFLSNFDLILYLFILRINQLDLMTGKLHKNLSPYLCYEMCKFQ